MHNAFSQERYSIVEEWRRQNSPQASLPLVSIQLFVRAYDDDYHDDVHGFQSPYSRDVLTVKAQIQHAPSALNENTQVLTPKQAFWPVAWPVDSGPPASCVHILKPSILT